MEQALASSTMNNVFVKQCLQTILCIKKSCSFTKVSRKRSDEACNIPYRNADMSRSAQLCWMTVVDVLKDKSKRERRAPG